MKNVPLKYMSVISLGKMLQSTPAHADQEVFPYLKASTLTENGLDLSSLQQMPFSRREQEILQLQKDDVVVVEGGSIGRSAWISEDMAGIYFQNSINRVRPKIFADGRYLKYAIESRRASGFFEAITNQATIRHLTADKLANTPVPYLNQERQRKIADYLDHETAEIDAFIADLRGAGELRKERWRSGRDRALTFGVSGDGGRTRKSATWFDVQRADWSEGPLKRLFDITLGKMLDEKQHVETIERHPYIRAGNIQDGLLELEDVNTMPFTPGEQTKFSLREMDLLVVEGGSVGTNVVLNQDLPGMYFQKTVNRMRPRLGASSYYYSEVLNAYRDRGVFDVVANKSTIQHLTADKLANLEVPIPPVHEQHEIADALSKSREKVASVGLDIAQAIDLARERRAALITAAVTGQIDVTARNKPAAEQLEDDIAQGRHRESA